MKKLLSTLLIICSYYSYAQVNDSAHYYVKTTDSLPFLNYGLGQDRLGGAKMTFLDSGVVLKVIDSSGRNYKVQLSNQHTAFIEKKHVIKTNHYQPRQHLTGSWSVYGDSVYDYTIIQLDEKLPYRAVMQINPSRIVLEIFGAVSNTNWITQLKTAKEIKNVWYEQSADDVMKVFIELKHPQHWGYDIYYSGRNRLTVKVKRQPEKLNLRNMTIAIDAGHGGTQAGAKGVKTGILEKDYTLLIAKELETKLRRKNVNVIMTRDIDTTLAMYDRLSFLKKHDPDMLISIHLNSSSRESASGVSTYYRYIGFRPLSQFILEEMKELDLNDFGNIGGFNFSLSGPTEYLNCLVEVAFLSNISDEQKILDPRFRKKTAVKITNGIKAFLKDNK